MKSPEELAQEVARAIADHDKQLLGIFGRDTIANAIRDAVKHAKDDLFHDVILAAAHAEAGAADFLMAGDKGGARVRDSTLRHVGAAAFAGGQIKRTLADMRGLICLFCGQPPIAMAVGGGNYTFACKCGKTESPSPSAGPGWRPKVAPPVEEAPRG